MGLFWKSRRSTKNSADNNIKEVKKEKTSNT